MQVLVSKDLHFLYQRVHNGVRVILWVCNVAVIGIKASRSVSSHEYNVR